jgi:hypothetical protein
MATAERLRSILGGLFRRELKAQKAVCLSGEELQERIRQGDPMAMAQGIRLQIQDLGHFLKGDTLSESDTQIRDFDYTFSDGLQTDFDFSPGKNVPPEFTEWLEQELKAGNKMVDLYVNMDAYADTSRASTRGEKGKTELIIHTQESGGPRKLTLGSFFKIEADLDEGNINLVVGVSGETDSIRGIWDLSKRITRDMKNSNQEVRVNAYAELSAILLLFSHQRSINELN